MITPAALQTGSVLQSSGGGISLEVILLVGLAAVVVLALAWMLTSGGSSSD